MARRLLIILALFCGLANAASPKGLLELKNTLNFDPSLWYFKSGGDNDTCSTIPENGPTRRGSKNFYQCSAETLGQVSCFCLSETLDNVPEMNPAKYVNMCAECQTGLMPIPQHAERFQDSIARKTIFRTLLGISPIQWDAMFGRFQFMVLPGGPLKDLNAARNLGRELKQLVRNSEDPRRAKALVRQMVLKSARKLPFPLLRNVITEEGMIKPPFGSIVDRVIRHFGGLFTRLGAPN